MGRRRFFKFKFKLTRKQKRRLTAFAVIALFAAGGFWIYQHPPKRPPQPKIKRTEPQPRRVEPRRQRAPTITFVIDDIGSHDKFKKQLAALGADVTYAILPLLSHSRAFGHLSETTGAEVILHMPLDTVQDMIPGRGLIVETMSKEDILDMLARDLDSVPNHVGANNHMGSRGTTDREMMSIILRELKRRGLFFLDSYTTKDSVVPEICRAVGLPVLTRGVFLDNSDSKDAIRDEIKKLERIARDKGTAIAIGHYRKNTLEVLAKEIPRIRKEGFEIISLKEHLKFQRD